MIVWYAPQESGPDMQKFDSRDLTGGVMLLLLGVFIVWHAATALPLGSPRRMGPGMFPVVIGGLLVLFGVLIAVPALWRRGDIPVIEWRTAMAILAGIVVFGAAIRAVGIVPALILQLLVTSFAEQTFRPVVLLAMAVAFPIVAYLIFSLGLGLPIPMLNWPL